MSAEKMFIRDLIHLCEQYGMVIYHPGFTKNAIVRKSDEPHVYELELELIRELE